MIIVQSLLPKYLITFGWTVLFYDQGLKLKSNIIYCNLIFFHKMKKFASVHYYTGVTFEGFALEKLSLKAEIESFILKILSLKASKYRWREAIIQLQCLVYSYVMIKSNCQKTITPHPPPPCGCHHHQSPPPQDLFWKGRSNCGGEEDEYEWRWAYHQGREEELAGEGRISFFFFKLTMIRDLF